MFSEVLMSFWRQNQKTVHGTMCVAIALVAMTIMSIQSVAAGAQEIAPERPNILVLMAEDLSPRIGVWGDALARTPNIDRLAREGVRYTHAFTTAGVCAPSRAAMITGQYQISFGGQHMRTTTGPLGEYLAVPDEAVKAYPELLRAAGYYTFTDAKLDYQFSGAGAGSGPFTIWDAEGAGTTWRGRAPDQPFFGLINFMHTHESGVMRPSGAPHSAEHLTTQRMRLGGRLVAESVTDPAKVLLPPYYPDLAPVRADLARHYDNIAAMDSAVGRVLADLEADGLTGQTIVIFATDHGDGLPRAKRELFDSGLQVPLVMRAPASQEHWSGGPPGSVSNRLVSLVDLAPTVLGLAGIALPPFLHGRSWLDGVPRDYVFAARDRIDEVEDRQRAVRDARYKYIRSWYPETPGGHALEYRDNLDMVRAMRAAFEAGELTPAQARWFEPPGRAQLYDLKEDPFEVDNLAGRPDYAAVESRLATELTRWLAEVGDMGEVPEALMRAGLLDNGKIRETPAPTANESQGLVSLTATHRASIGWRESRGAWRLYAGPFARPRDGNGKPVAIEARAVRYGWRESEIVEF